LKTTLTLRPSSRTDRARGNSFAGLWTSAVPGSLHRYFAVEGNFAARTRPESSSNVFLAIKMRATCPWRGVGTPLVRDTRTESRTPHPVEEGPRSRHERRSDSRCSLFHRLSRARRIEDRTASPGRQREISCCQRRAVIYL
jgi:hypothetical protein